MILSSQDLRNSYENFYIRMRNYLWSYDALKALANVEADIFTAFIDYDFLRKDIGKLYSFIREVAKEDNKLQKAYDEVMELIDDAQLEDTKLYVRLGKVEEVNPNNEKTIRRIPEEEEEEIVYENNEETAR